MKILITGAGSYFGSYLIPFLQKQGVLLEAITSQKLPEIPCHNISYLDRRGLKALIERFNPDSVIHLAGTRQGKTFSDFVGGNIEFAAHLFEVLLETNRLIPTLVVGTAAEYGPVPAEHSPVSEEYRPQPISFYGTSKYIQTILAQFASQQGLPVITARVFNVIGPHLPQDLVLGKFMEQLEYSPQEIKMGNLESVRDFIDIRDVVEIFWKLIQSPLAFGETINVCTGRPVKTGDFLNQIAHAFGSTIPITSQSAVSETEKPLYSCGNPEKLLKIIGPYSFRSLEDSVQFLKKMSEPKVTRKVA